MEIVELFNDMAEQLAAKDAEIVRLKAEVESWQSRFRALVNADAPDSAGNAVLTLNAALHASEELVRRLADELNKADVIGDGAYLATFGLRKVEGRWVKGNG